MAASRGRGGFVLAVCVQHTLLLIMSVYAGVRRTHVSVALWRGVYLPYYNLSCNVPTYLAKFAYITLFCNI